MIRKTLALLITLLALCLPTAAQAERVALVIGNGSYQHVADLANPPGDARAVADELTALGFAAPTVLVNAGLTEMRDALEAFRDRAAGSELALIYFAGHGLNGGGENYIMPVDANPTRPRDLPYHGIGVGCITGQMTDSGAEHVLFILDACRNDGFETNFAAEDRAVSRGFARLDTPFERTRATSRSGSPQAAATPPWTAPPAATAPSPRR